MKIPITEQRQIENEMIFRRSNEQVGIDLNTIDAMHVEDGNPELARDEDMVLQFRCECSDENCAMRIAVSLSVYQKIHLNRSSFIIMPSHQVEAIEKLVHNELNYSVAEKNNSMSEPGIRLNNTSTTNT